MSFTVAELCAGGGGQALGLEMAGFHHAAAVEFEPQYCTTLRLNRPHWNVIQQDIRSIRPSDFSGVDLIAAGVPCPPFSIAGRQLGADDERDMFPAALEIVASSRPRAVLFENVPGLASTKFSDYRKALEQALNKLGYQTDWRLLNSSAFGVPQLRPRFILVALLPKDAECFQWPTPQRHTATVGETLVDLMAMNGWLGAEQWQTRANGIAPTIVGGSKKHGGPDLGPTRAKAQWRLLHVDGLGIADQPPEVSFPFDGLPRLTTRMVARIQSFPDTWQFSGKKTVAYRQIGNAFPPLVAKHIGMAIRSAFIHEKTYVLASEAPLLEARLLESPPKLCLRKKGRKHAF